MSSLPVYGLSENPYTRRELDPLQNTGDLDLVSYVDGWGEITGDQGLRTGGTTDKPTIVVIDGASGTGRTSVANYIIYRWAELCHNKARIIRVVHEMEDYATPGQLYAWALKVEGRILEEGFGLQPATEDIIGRLEQGMPDREALDAVVRKLLRFVVRDLAAQGCLLAGIFEGMNDKNFLSLARKTFDGVGVFVALIIDSTFVTERDVLRRVDDYLPGQAHLRVTLHEIYGLDVKEVIEKRWGHASGGLCSPFERAAVDAAFERPPRSIARALALVEEILNMKQKLYGHRSPWPESREVLAFDQEALAGAVSFVDNLIRH